MGPVTTTRPDEMDATQLTHVDILNRVCAQLDLSHPKELIPFSIRVSNLLAFGNKLQAFVHEVCCLMEHLWHSTHTHTHTHTLSLSLSLSLLERGVCTTVVVTSERFSMSLTFLCCVSR
jgi:hypothetical protein